MGGQDPGSERQDPEDVRVLQQLPRRPGGDQREIDAHVAGHAGPARGRADGTVVMTATQHTGPWVAGRLSWPCERRPQLPVANRPGTGASMHSLDHLSDSELLRHLTALVAKDRFHTAVLLA